MAEDEEGESEGGKTGIRRLFIERTRRRRLRIRKEIEKANKLSIGQVSDSKNYSGESIQSLREKIRQVSSADVKKTFQLDSIKFSPGGKKDCDDLLAFSDFERLKDFLGEKFLDGRPLLPGHPIIKINWTTPSKSAVEIHYVLSFDNTWNCTVWIIECNKVKRRQNITSSSEDGATKVKEVIGRIGETSIATSVQEIIRFAMRIILGGSA